MSINIGLDIGGVSLKLAAIGTPEDRRALERLCARHQLFLPCEAFRPNPLGVRPVIFSGYFRLQGSPIEATFDLLREFYEEVPEQSVEGIRVTGSGSKLIAKVLGIYFENEFKAIAKAIRTCYPQVRTVLEMGGESAKYLRLDPEGSPRHLGIVDYQVSGDCAAGTGSFLDVQASRLCYAVEEIGEVACQAHCAARIAGRCSVFAKTDMIHAQQKGYKTDEILKGLCDAVARNLRSSIIKGKPLIPPVAFIGAVSQNRGVRQAICNTFKLSDADLFVPELYAWLGALGAALFEAEEWRKRSLKHIHQLQQHAGVSRETFACTEPLSLSNVLLLRNLVEPYRFPDTQEPIEAYLGIDVGSVSTNLVVLDAAGNLMKEIYLPTQGRPIEVVHAGLQEIERELGDHVEIRGVGTTGSGRELIGELVGADTVNDEITAHKTGAMHINARLGGDPVDTIFEVGGQDSKFISIENGVVVDFTMNEACAAGTGSFLEEQAEKMGINIKEEFASLALASKTPARLGERCTVFMERDVTALMHKGAEKTDLCAGLAYSVALNYLNRVVRGRRISKTIYFQGGTAYNDSVAAAFSQILGKRIIVPPHNGVIGAIGMALIAQERIQRTGLPTRFRGYNLYKINFTSREFICQACANYCEMKVFLIAGEKSYWGDKCSDKFRKRTRSERQPVIPDLMARYDELLLEGYEPKKADGRPRVGIPRAMYFFDRFPFWRRYLEELGFAVVLSEPTNKKISTEGAETAVAEPCFPVKLAHGHVENLLEGGVDYILLPNTLNIESPDARVDSHLCPWNQTLPFVIRTVPEFESAQEKFLIPTVHFRLGIKHVQKELAKLAQRLRCSRRRSDAAVLAAYAAQREFTARLHAAGREALAILTETDEPGIVLVGRPYNLYDRVGNCDIPRKLRTIYGVNVLPSDFLPLDNEDISDINANMYWNSGRKILAAAKLVRKHPNLHIIFITNFKCGPDSYIKSFLGDAAGKPSLLLQFDGHSNDAGFITRCEAYLDSKGVLRCSAPPRTHTSASALAMS